MTIRYDLSRRLMFVHPARSISYHDDISWPLCQLVLEDLPKPFFRVRKKLRVEIEVTPHALAFNKQIFIGLRHQQTLVYRNRIIASAQWIDNNLELVFSQLLPDIIRK